jgi:hypothetical protein
MSVNLRVHEMAVVEDPFGINPPKPVLIAEHHYIRLFNKALGAEFPMFVQHGQVLGEAGEAWALEDVPMWFWRELANPKSCSLQALASVEGRDLLIMAKMKLEEEAKAHTEPIVTAESTTADAVTQRRR